ncbi:MAG: hypothetical protein ACR2JE_04515, partial [Acidobacteriaceae bacterium]
MAGDLLLQPDLLDPEFLDAEPLLEIEGVSGHAAVLSLEGMAAADRAGHQKHIKKLESKALNGAIFIVLT